MKWLALVALAACGGAQPQPETIRRPTEDKAAIAPPPPAPDVETAPPPKAEAKKLTFEEAVRPATSFDIADPTGAPGSAKLVGSVLVWLDAPFFLAPTDSAPALQLGKLPDRKNHIGEAVPMRVVSTKGAFVEVETPITDSLRNAVHDCAWFATKSQHDIGRWRLFVKRADLAQVVTKKFSTTFADGSRVEIEPGMPILGLADGKSLVGFHRVWVPVSLPAAATGYAYPTPPPPVEPEPVDSHAKTEEPPYKHVLDTRVVGIADTQQPLRGAYSPRAVTIETKGDRVAFPLDDVCGQLTVIANASDVKPYKPSSSDGGFGFGGLGYGEAIGVERWFIPRGTRLVAENGGASATAAKDITVEKPAAGAKQVCVQRYPFVHSSYVFGPEIEKVSEAKVNLCVARGTLKHEKARSWGSGSGSVLGSGGGLGGRQKPPAKK